MRIKFIVVLVIVALLLAGVLFIWIPEYTWCKTSIEVPTDEIALISQIKIGEGFTDITGIRRDGNSLILYSGLMKDDQWVLSQQVVAGVTPTGFEEVQITINETRVSIRNCEGSIRYQ